MRKTLLEIMQEENLLLNEQAMQGTDKLTKHPYSDDYEPLFEPWRDKPVRLLEIGAYHGASTIAWDKYFPLGDITVVDNQPRKSLENIKGRVDESRTRILIGDAYTQEFADTLGTFDIVNDDGPHNLESMKKCIELYYPKLNSGGVLIIEDIPSAEWFDEFIAMVPDKKYECIDYSKRGKGASDSKVFLVWRE